VAHWGVAEGPCFTYSIGFLASSRRDLVQSFLGYLQHELGARVPDELLGDPGLTPAHAPLEIGDDHLAHVTRTLGAIRFGRADIEDFLGRFLTLPKPRVRFAPGRSRGRMIALALPSRALVRGRRIYLNGEAFPRSPALDRLAWERRAPLSSLRGKDREIVAGWLEAGWVERSTASTRAP
jgi:50S ribosomal protein L16 3-hydroxylase